MINGTYYRIIEGSPQFVADTCDTMIELGWECNGLASIFQLNNKIVAFQGMINKSVLKRGNYDDK